MGNNGTEPISMEGSSKRYSRRVAAPVMMMALVDLFDVTVNLQSTTNNKGDLL